MSNSIRYDREGKGFRLCGFLVVLAVAWAVRPAGGAEREAPGVPGLNVSEKEWDFGTIPSGKLVHHDVTLSNGGSEVLELAAKSARSCACRVLFSKKELKIAPGESVSLRVTFRPAHKSGRQTETVRLTTKGPKASALVLQFSAMVVNVSRSAITELPSKWPDLFSDSPGVQMVYFFDPRCPNCAGVTRALKRMSQQYPRINVLKVDVTIGQGGILQEAFSIVYRVRHKRRGIPPTIFLPTRALIDTKEIETELPPACAELALRSGCVKSLKNIGQARIEQSIIARFETFAPAAVFVAGLVDSVNPCALAILVFFISCLTLGRRQVSQVLFVGLAFTAGTFASYFLVGLGLYRVIELLHGLRSGAAVIYPVMACVCGALAAYSFSDYLLARSGRAGNMSLQLPAPIKRLSQAIIRRGIKVRYIALAAFGVAAIIALLELVCTGQVYLPTLTMLAGLEGYRTQAILYLLLYNLAFVVPMLAILGAVCFGLKTLNLTRLFTKNIARLKLTMTILFTFFTLVMIAYSLAARGIL